MNDDEYVITVKQIIKQFKIPEPTTGKPNLVIWVDDDVKIKYDAVHAEGVE